MSTPTTYPTHGGPITEELDAYAQDVLNQLHCAALSVSWGDDNGIVATVNTTT